MTVQNPAFFLGTEDHPAEGMRRFVATLFGDSEGVIEPDGLAVTEKSGTPDMSVDVAGGRAVVKGDEATFQGSYWVENEGTTNKTIGTAHPTNPRRDLVIARVQDSEYSGSDNEWDIEVVEGTAAAVPADPATPDNAIVLARVAVAAAATSITDANITDLRPRAWGLTGVAVCTSTTRPSSPYEGQVIYQTDNDVRYVWNGSVWLPTGAVWSAVGSALTASTSFQPVTGASLTLPAGKFTVEARIAWSVSNASPRSYNARLQDTTSSSTLDTAVAGSVATVNTVPTVSLFATTTLSAAATIRLEGSVSAVDGVQSMAYARIWARPVTAIL